MATVAAQTGRMQMEMEIVAYAEEGGFESTNHTAGL
jgi:hypothetical protein